MKGAIVNVGASGVPRQMAGLPVYELAAPIHFVVSVQDVEEAVPRDCDKCAISLAAKRQLQSPLAHIGSANAYIAIPDSDGRPVEGFGKTKYVVLAAVLSKPAQALMRAIDLEQADPVGQIIALQPRKPSEHPEAKAIKNGRRKTRGPYDPPRPRMLIEEGIRNYSGRVWA